MSVAPRLALATVAALLLGAEPCRPGLGPQRTVVLIAVFESSFDAYPWPRDLADAAAHFFGAGDSLDAWLREASYGRAWLAGSVHGFFELPGSYGAYCGGGECLWNALARDAIAAADPAVDFAGVRRIVLVFGGALDAFAWGTRGEQAFETDEGVVHASVTWLDRATMGRAGARAHELGHNLGARHALRALCGERSFDATGEAFVAPALPRSVEALVAEGFFFGDRCPLADDADPNDAMGGDPDAARHVSAIHKERFGWLAPHQVHEVPARADTTIVELGLFERAGTGVRAIRVPVFDGFQPGVVPSSLFAWVLEYRREVGFDAGSGVEGVLVRLAVHPDLPFDFDTLTLGAEPVVLRPGVRFEDPRNEGLTIEVRAMSERGATVAITRHGAPDLSAAGCGADRGSGGSRPRC